MSTLHTLHFFKGACTLANQMVLVQFVSCLQTVFQNYLHDKPSVNFPWTTEKWRTCNKPSVVGENLLRECAYSIHSNFSTIVIANPKNTNCTNHCTNWAANILCVRWKNWQDLVRYKRLTNCSFTGTKYAKLCSQTICFASVYAPLRST